MYNVRQQLRMFNAEPILLEVANSNNNNVQQSQIQSQSQIQIQKVQQITPPTGGGRTSQVSAVSVRKQADGTYAHEEQQHQAQLCPITGKILGQDDHVMSQHQQQQQHHMQSGVMNTQLFTSAGGEQHLSLQQQQDHHQQQQQQQLHDIDPTLLLTNDQQMLTNEDGTPLLVTGEDGTVCQVAGKNAEGQTILVTQGPDGEQQFAYVAAAEGDENQVLTLDNAVAEAVAQHPNELHQQNKAMQEPQYIVKTNKEDGTTHVGTMSEGELQQHQALVAAQQQQQHVDGDSGVATGGATSGQLCIQTSDGGDGQEENIPAEVILSFTIHSKPKIRKAAQHAIVSIIHGSSFMRPANTDEGEATANVDQPQVKNHPASSRISKFCLRQFKPEVLTNSQTTVLHTLILPQRYFKWLQNRRYTLSTKQQAINVKTQNPKSFTCNICEGTFSHYSSLWSHKKLNRGRITSVPIVKVQSMQNST